jgi:hypothetical protein
MHKVREIIKGGDAQITSERVREKRHPRQRQGDTMAQESLSRAGLMRIPAGPRAAGSPQSRPTS